MGIAFKVYVRCANCSRDYGSRLDAPDAEDAPADIDELLDSNFLRDQRFTCSDCESPIGVITGVKELRDEMVVSTRAICA